MVHIKRSILITGVAGTGKSSTCRALAAAGYAAYDVDEIPGLCTMVDKVSGKAVADYEDSVERLRRSGWVCDKKKMAAIIKKEKSDTAFYGALSWNLKELLPLFDAIILLRASDEVLLERLNSREKAFGKDPAVQSHIIGWRKEWEKDMLESGAILVDADRPMREVVHAIVQRVINKPSE